MLSLTTPKNQVVVKRKPKRGRARRKPTRRRQLALAWMKELEDSYGIDNLDVPLDRFICFTMLRIATKAQLEEPEIEDEDMEPEIGDTYQHHLIQMLRLRHEGRIKECATSMKRRADRAAVLAAPPIKRLKKAGYRTIRSLLMCPLKKLVPAALAEGISDSLTQLRERHPKIFTDFPPCDTRYRRSATDLRTVQANPLPPLLQAKSGLAPISDPDPDLIASIKKVNAQRPHHYEAYEGRQSTQRAMVQCKVKRLWNDSFKRKSGRDYHYIKAIPKLTHKLLRTIKTGGALPKDLQQSLKPPQHTLSHTLSDSNYMDNTQPSEKLLSTSTASMIDTLMDQKHPGGHRSFQEVDSLLADTWPAEMKSLLFTLTSKSDA